MKSFFVILLSIFSTVSFAQNVTEKEDMVVIQNGDKITGEVKFLQDNILTYKTDDMGTLKIKWDKVLHIASKNTFRIELRSGSILIGSLDSTETNGFVRIVVDSIWTEVKTIEVVEILKINNTILGRIDGEIGLGYSFTKSSAVHQLNGRLNVSYQANRNLSEIRSTAIFTNQNDSILTSKADLLLKQSKIFNKHWFSSLSWALQQNSELGIQRRSIGTATYGKFLIKRNRLQLQLSGGLAANNESYFESSDGSKRPDQIDLESVFKLQYKHFSNNEPEFNIFPSIIMYPSLTDWGRLRSDINIDLKFEVLHDFFFNLTYYHQLDNRPPESGTTSDYGIITSFNLTF